MSNRKIIRFCLNDDILIEELEKLEFEGRDTKDIVVEALSLYLLEGELEDNHHLSVSKK